MPRSRITLTCLRCGKVFSRLQYQERLAAAKRAGGPFCGCRCSSIWKREQRAIKTVPLPIPCRDVTEQDPPWLPFAIAKAGHFWAHIDTSNACWLWKGGRDKEGYGKYAVSLLRADGTKKQVNLLAHRVAYILTRGNPAPGLLIRHTCDTPPCCNPDHLLPGTDADNSADCVARGRIARGARNGRSRARRAEKMLEARNG